MKIKTKSMALMQSRFYAVLGQRIHAARKSARVSQESLAISIGMSRSSVANIETGRQPVYIHALVRIAEQLGKSLSDLVPFAEPKPEIYAHERQLSHLGLGQREWVDSVIRRVAPGEEGENGTEIRSGKKARRRTTKRRKR